MKIAVNRDWGGFSISTLAASRLMTEHGIPFVHEDCVLDEEIELEGEFCYMYKEWVHLSFDRDQKNWRTDPRLIEVIETLGTEDASGPCGCVKVVEIPDDVENWHFSDYDGAETIHEDHRTW